MSKEKTGYCIPPVHAQFKKGGGGNPRGSKPTGPNKGTILKQMLSLELPTDHPLIEKAAIRLNLDPKKKYTAEQVMDLQSIRDILNEDYQHRHSVAKDIRDRLHGKPHQTIQLDQTADVKIIEVSPYDPKKDPENAPKRSTRARKGKTK